MAALFSRPVVLLGLVLVLLVITIVTKKWTSKEYFDANSTTPTPTTPIPIPPTTIAATVPTAVVPVPLSTPQQSVTSMVPPSIVQSAQAPPISGTNSPVTSSISSTTFATPAAPGNPSMLPSNAAAIVAGAIAPAAEIPPWQDDVIGNWQLIQFDSQNLPTDVVGLSTDPGVNGVYAIRVINPQHYYFVCTISDVARLGLTTTSPISTGHKPSEFPLGYGGSTCSQSISSQQTQTSTIGTKSVAAAAILPLPTQGMRYVAGSSPPLIEANLKPTQMSLPFADCPFQASNASRYEPLFNELHSIQTQMQDETARLKMVSDRLQRIGKQNSYPMPLAESNAAY